MGEDKRRRMRVEVGDFSAVIDTEAGSFPVRLGNLSLKGLGCTGHAGLELGQACTVRLTLGAGVEVAVEGVVVRSDGGRAAVDFTSMDPDSFYHLRRIVQLHASDPDAVDQELRFPAFVHPTE